MPGGSRMSSFPNHTRWAPRAFPVAVLVAVSACAAADDGRCASDADCRSGAQCIALDDAWPACVPRRTRAAAPATDAESLPPAPPEPPAPPGQLEVRVQPAVVAAPGGDVVITWTADPSFAQCTLAAGPQAPLVVTSPVRRSVLATQTLVVTCTTTGGDVVEASAVVALLALETPTLLAEAVPAGSSPVLSWHASPGASCDLWAEPSGGLSAPIAEGLGNDVVGFSAPPIVEPTAYHVVCRLADATLESAAVRASILPAVSDVRAALAPDMGHLALTWQAAHVDFCEVLDINRVNARPLFVFERARSGGGARAPRRALQGRRRRGRSPPRRGRVWR